MHVVVERDGAVIARAPFEGQTLTIGRDPKADLPIDERSLSRSHVRIERRGAGFWVMDLGSANGTFVNGERIVEARRLNGGDEVRLGACFVRVEGVEVVDARLPMVVISGPHGTSRFAIVGDGVVIGRDAACDICIPDKGISRRHVSVKVEGETFVVEDMGSQNGTLFRGKPLRGAGRLFAGDAVTFSGHTIEFGFHDPDPGVLVDDDDAPQHTMIIDRSIAAQVAMLDGNGMFSRNPDDEWDGPGSITGER